MDINLLTSSVVISPVPSLIPLTRENLMFGLWYTAIDTVIRCRIRMASRLMKNPWTGYVRKEI